MVEPRSTAAAIAGAFYLAWIQPVIHHLEAEEREPATV